MKKVVWFCDFQDAFRNYLRENSFSYEGLKALYDYIEEYEESCWIEMELDVIALDCEFTEYSSIKEAYEVYENDYAELCEDEEDRDERANQYLLENTQVIHMDNGGIIISNF